MLLAVCVLSPVSKVQYCLNALIHRAAFIFPAYLDELAGSGRQVDRCLKHGALDSECYTKESSKIVVVKITSA